MKLGSAARSIRRGITTLQTLGALLLVLALLAVGMTMGNCSFGPGAMPTGFTTNAQAEAVFLPPGSPTTIFFANMGWPHVGSPLYSDDQRLLGEGGAYGQHAGVYPSPALDTLSHRGMAPPGTAGVLVGVMEVHSDPAIPALPGTYQDMGVNVGFNCLYIRSGSPWRAFVGPLNGAGECDLTYTGTTSLSVRVDTFPTPPPPVVRFHEGANATRGITEGAPYIGIKCGVAWCSIHHANVATKRPPLGENSMPGVGDGQHLAIVDDPSQPLVRSDQEAVVTPAANFSSISADQFKFDYQHVADVVFKRGPSGKYVSKWGFEIKTENEIYLKSDNTGKNWNAMVIRRTYVLGLPMPFKRKFHRRANQDPHVGMTLPATVRFMWDPADEDLWVRCNDGCCKVSPS